MLNDINYVHGDQDVQVPAHLNFGKFMLNNLLKFKDHIAIVNAATDKKVTYNELIQDSVDLAVSLSELGVGRNDNVAICMERRNEFLQTILAVIYTGAAYTPVELDCGRAVLRHKFDVTKPRYLICSKLFWKTYEGTLNSMKYIENVITLDDGPEFAVRVSKLLNKNTNVDLFRPTEVKGQNDVTFVLFSSGTTGMPKGVMLTHENCILNSLPHDFREDSLKVALVCGNWYHNYEIFMSFKFLASGRKLVFWEDETIDSLLKAIAKYEVNIAMLVPSIIVPISKLDVDEVNLYKTDSLKVIYSRSAPLHYKTMELVKERFPKIEKVLQGYGMTESGELTSESWCTKGYKLGSVGMPSPGITLKVVDVNTRQILGPNKHGEICVQGPFLMKGYIDVDPSTYLDEQGFFKTGDLGYYDEDHYFYIVERIKEIIEYFGCKVAPIELETVIQMHPDVKEAGVVGKPDPEYGELPTAFVVRKEGAKVTDKELIDYVASQVSPFMQLRGGVLFVSEIPRNPRKKILRKRLREMLNELNM